jgi:hypothetical protein
MTVGMMVSAAIFLTAVGMTAEEGMREHAVLFSQRLLVTSGSADRGVDLPGTSDWAGVLRLGQLQGTSQGLESSHPFAFRQQRRGGLDQPHPAEELTLRDVMNNRLLMIRSRKYSGRAPITAEPNHRSVSRNPIRDLPACFRARARPIAGPERSVGSPERRAAGNRLPADERG